MISDSRSDANRKVLIKGVSEHLLPTAQASGFWWPGIPGAAPGTGNCHIDLFGHLLPGQALVTKLQDLLCGGGMSGRTGATHSDAGTAKLMAHGSPGNTQLGTDLAQAPTLGVQVSRTLDVHCDTVTSLSRTMSGLVQESAQRQFVFICQWAATRLGEAPARRRWRRSSRAPRPNRPFAMSLHTFTKAKARACISVPPWLSYH
jgi:hypothetical protein